MSKDLVTSESRPNAVAKLPPHYAAIVEEYAPRIRCAVAPTLRDIEGMDVSHDGRWIAAYEGRQLRVWRENEREPSLSRAFDNDIVAVAIGGNRVRVTTAHLSGAVMETFLDDAASALRGAMDGGVTAIAINVSGENIACADRNGMVRVWTNGSAEEMTNEDPIFRLEFGTDGRLLYLYTRLGIDACDIRTGDRLGRYAFDAELQTTPPKAGVFTAIRGSTLYVWDAESYRPVETVRFLSGIAAIDHPVDHSVVAGIARNGTIGLFDKSTNEQETFYSYYQDANAIKSRADGVYVAGSDPSVIKMQRGRVFAACYSDQTVPIIAAAVSADEAQIAVGDQDGGLSLYDLRHCVRAKRYEFAGAGSLSAVALDERWIAAGSHKGSIYLIARGNDASPVEISVGKSEIQGIALTADGHVICGNAVGQILQYEPNDGAIVCAYRPHQSNIRSVAVHGNSVLAAGEDGCVSMFETGTDTPVWHRQLAQTIYPARIDDTGEYCVTGDMAGNVNIWACDDGRHVTKFDCDANWIRGVHFAQGRVGVIGIYGKARVWDSATGELVFSADIDDPRRTRFIYFNREFTRVLVTGAAGLIRSFDTDTGREVACGFHLVRGRLWAAHDDESIEWYWTDRRDFLRYEMNVAQGKHRPASSKETKQFHGEHHSQTHTALAVGMAVPEHLRDLPRIAAPADNAVRMLLPVLED